MDKKINQNKGFTLVEIIVAIGIFTFVLFISTGSIFSIFEANRKSQNTRAIMDNLNYMLESMTRTIRFGNTYHCDVTVGSPSSPRDCGSGASSMAVSNSSGIPVRYRLNGTSIERSTDSGVTYLKLTSSDVTITNLTFRVFGSSTYASGDRFQPQAIIVISGYAGARPTSRTSFTLQTTVSQRLVDSI